MDIISKREGPRAEDLRARRMIAENSTTIRRLADQISNGGYTKMQEDKARRAEQPQAEGLIIRDLKAPRRDQNVEPYVKVSLNGRVVLVDKITSRQLQMLGEIRGPSMARRFVLATAENGFLSPVDDQIGGALAPFAEIPLTRAYTEKDLARAIEEALGV